MSDSAKRSRRSASYEDILKLSDSRIGEIVDGELFVSPRPSSKHALAASRLTVKLGSPFGGGGEGPGGWWILSEPEIHAGREPNQDVFVPDLAGWRRERMSEFPDVPYFDIIPDWVCEIPPSNMRVDRTKKVPQYATLGVKHLWLINPRDKTLEAFRLEGGKWVVISQHVEADKVRVEPFEAVELDLGILWS